MLYIRSHIYYHLESENKTISILCAKHDNHKMRDKMKKVTAIIERGDDGTYGIHAPQLKNVIIGEGDTVAEAKEDFGNSYNEMVMSYVDDGQPVPDELRDVEFEYRYDLSAFYDAHPYLNVSKLAEHLHVNASLMRQYRQGQYISEEQVMRIQEGIRNVGREVAETILVR